MLSEKNDMTKEIVARIQAENKVYYESVKYKIAFKRNRNMSVYHPDITCNFMWF